MISSTEVSGPRPQDRDNNPVVQNEKPREMSKKEADVGASSYSKSSNSPVIAVQQQQPRKSSQGGKYHILNLEEAKGLPIFWNGKESVSGLSWKITPGDLKFSLMTIGEVLEKFTAKDYLRYSNVSISTNNRVFSTLRVSDAFSTLFPGAQEGKIKSVKLILNEAFKADRSKELSHKYVLSLTEGNKKKVFWDGRKCVPGMVARLNEAHMLQTLETILKKYVSSDYLKHDGIVQLVVNKVQPDGARTVKLDDILGSLYYGTSASLIVTNSKSELGNTPADPQPDNLVSSTDLDAFENRSLDVFWLGGNWLEIREKCHYLIDTYDQVFRERKISKYFSNKMAEDRRALETAMRRRNRSIDEVWRSYESLKTTIEMATSTFRYKPELVQAAQKSITTVDGPMSVSSDPTDTSNTNFGRTNSSTSSRRSRNDAPPPSDSAMRLLGSHSTTGSCFDVFAARLRGCGLEILDEDNRVSPIAGVAFTIAAVVAACAIAHYLSSVETK